MKEGTCGTNWLRGGSTGRDNDRTAGFTLVELLVVVTIVGILLALLLPAVQAAREAARKSACQNHVKQLACAALMHESLLRIFPTGGWDGSWLGHPDRGFDNRQPGGWIYNILPFLEQQALHQLGASDSGMTIDDANALRLATPLPILNCPSRRQPGLYPNALDIQYKLTAGVKQVPRTDYAVNGGDYAQTPTRHPGTLAQADSPGYWSSTDMQFQTGISHHRSQVTLADIRDGGSNTMFIGEKSIDSDHYMDGKDLVDSRTQFCGFASDLVRWTGISGTIGTASFNNLPRQDKPLTFLNGYQNQWFGSAHAGGLNMSLCDGSVRWMSFGIDAETFRRLGNRRDGQWATTPP